jgi:hypothetical protein
LRCSGRAAAYYIDELAEILERAARCGSVHDILAGAEKEKTTILGPIRGQLTAKFGRLKD